MSDELLPPDEFEEFEEGHPFDLEEAKSRRDRLVQDIKDIDTQVADRNMTDDRGRRLSGREFWGARQQLLTAKRQKERHISVLNGWIRREAAAPTDPKLDDGGDAKLLDGFAKAALSTLRDNGQSAELIARRAYEIADAMLAEREKR